jgi:hypothetical protein
MTNLDHILLFLAVVLPFIHFIVAERFYYRVRHQLADLDDKVAAIMEELGIEESEKTGPKR